MARGKKHAGGKAKIKSTFTPAFGRGKKGRGKKSR
jgi:hypothetical protein